MPVKASSTIDQKFKASGHLINTRTTAEPLPLVYGFMRIGGNQVAVNSISVPTREDNNDLYIVQTLCEGEIEEITTVYFDDKEWDDVWFDKHGVQGSRCP